VSLSCYMIECSVIVGVGWFGRHINFFIVTHLNSVPIFILSLALQEESDEYLCRHIYIPYVTV